MLVTMIALSWSVGPAAAQERWRTYRETADEDERVVTLSISPLHLTIPMFEATGEFRVGENKSVAAIAGVGSEGKVALYEVGAQVRQYVIGDFDTGVNLGAEAKWGNANYMGATSPSATLGPFVGGKLTLALFSLELQGGGQVVWRDQEFAFGPLLNVQAGVSF